VGAKHKVTIQQDKKEYNLEVAEDESILEAAIEAGIELPHDCKLGVCLTCPAKVVSGVIDQEGSTLDNSVMEQGYALMCMCFPRSDTVIRCIEEDELVGAQFSGRS
jgi:ferredoxin